MQLHYALFQLNQASIVLSALSGSSRARCSVMTPPAVLKRRSEGTKRTEHYPAEISGTWYHFGRNRSRNRIRKNGRISGQPEPEPDIRYIPRLYMCQKLWKLAGSRQSYCKNYQAYFFGPPCIRKFLSAQFALTVSWSLKHFALPAYVDLPQWSRVVNYNEVESAHRRRTYENPKVLVWCNSKCLAVANLQDYKRLSSMSLQHKLL